VPFLKWLQLSNFFRKTLYFDSYATLLQAIFYLHKKSEMNNSKNIIYQAKLQANGDITVGDTFITNIYLNTDYEKLCEQERVLLKEIYFLSSNAKIDEKLISIIDEKQKSLDNIITQKQVFESYVIDLAIKLTYSSIDSDKLEKMMKLFAAGNYDEIEANLDISGLKQEQINLKNANQALEEQRRKNSDAYLILANVYAIKFDSATRFEDTCKLYQEAIESYECAENYYKFAIFLYSEMRLEDSNIIFSIIYKKYLKDLPPAFKATVLNDYGLILKNFRKLKEAENALKKAISIRKKLLKNDPVTYQFDLASSYNNMGVLKKQMNELAESKKYQEKALEIRKNIINSFSQGFTQEDLVKNNQYYSDTMSNLGNVHLSLLEWKKGEMLLKKALEIRKETEDLINPNKISLKLSNLHGIYMIFNNLGIMFLHRREFEESYSHFKEAEKILNELLRFNRQKFLHHKGELYSNLGLLKSEINQYEESKIYFYKSIEVFKELTNLYEAAFKPDLAIAYNNLGAMAKHNNDLDCAEECLKEALTIRRELLKTHPNVYAWNISNTLNNLGVTYTLKEDLENAEVYFREALDIRKNLIEKGKNEYIGDLAITLNDLGIVLANKKTSEAHLEALMLLEKALEIRKNLVESDRKAYIIYLKETLINIGVAKYNLNKDKSTLFKYCEECLDGAQIDLEPYNYEKLKKLINDTLFHLKIEKNY
jgi:Tetratricopeptide repeat